MPRYRFERLVADALDDLPDELAGVLDNVVVQVDDRHPDEPDLLGLYDGVPHTERTGHEGPDVVSIYRLALCELCDDEDDLAEEVYVTVIHELAHAAGIDDDRLHELGWAMTRAKHVGCSVREVPGQQVGGLRREEGLVELGVAGWVHVGAPARQPVHAERAGEQRRQRIRRHATPTGGARSPASARPPARGRLPRS